jgi:flagellar M-ring protein FliF
VDPQQLLARAKSVFASFTTGQLISLAGAFLLVVAIITSSAWWVKTPTYALLFSDMDADTAASIITRLKTQKVPYQLDEGGRGIRVPSDKVDELRIQYTSEGLPGSGRIGFEIFDKTQFGATEFLEQVNYRRALEGEIARTIATIAEVASARVHIAMGKDSLFGEPRPAKASVVLKLRGQRGLNEAAINGISNLVAASVEGLRPEAIVILDSFGRPLARPQDDANDPLGAAQMERQQRFEREMSERVVALLEPVVGADRVRVNVSMRLNPASREETEERWDPNAVVRSRQTTADQASAPGSGSIAGVRGNMPVDPKAPPPAPASVQTVAGSSRSAETTNYEISRMTRHVINPPGEIARLSVAVILDDDQVLKANAQGQKSIARKPRTREEIQKIQGLVSAAVGLEPARGDQLTVENVAFDEPIVEETAPPTMLQRITPQIKETGRVLVPVGLALFALLFFVRPLLARAGVRSPKDPAAPLAGALPAAPGQPLRTVADLESEIEAQLDAAASDRPDRKLPVLTRRVATMTLNEPENIAKLLRTWMGESER